MSHQLDGSSDGRSGKQQCRDLKTALPTARRSRKVSHREDRHSVGNAYPPLASVQIPAQVAHEGGLFRTPLSNGTRHFCHRSERRTSDTQCCHPPRVGAHRTTEGGSTRWKCLVRITPSRSRRKQRGKMSRASASSPLRSPSPTG